MYFNKDNNNKFQSVLICTLILLFFTALPVSAAKQFDAKITKIKINKNMLIGKTYNVKVSVKNTGGQSWSDANSIALRTSTSSSSRWNLPAIRLGEGERVKSGGVKQFNFQIQAPSDTGIYTLQFEMKNRFGAFGEKSKKLDIVTETRSNRVKFISQLLPDTMKTGQEYSIVVQYKNKGNSTWTRSSGYRLGLKSRKNNWGTTNVRLNKKEAISNGSIATFRFTLKAPEKPGIYPIQWQMKRGNLTFGEPTPKMYVKVMESDSGSGAEFVYQNVPGLQKMGSLYTIFERGKVYPVSITFKNTTDKSWSQGLVSMNAQNPPNSLTWSVDRVDLKKNEIIKPGSIKTFNFKVIAPLKPGIYNFQWQMVKGFKTWIGEKSENISITVK